ncbi:HSP90 family protein [Streptomyces sp. NPDC006012]|uniref:HSP90 family protein n=1 Tax=Streptomyces sp. NPDC006012 TaxID=3364739 RepID=UPI00368EDA6F
MAVELRGLVDLLSHHLYSSPRVYLRELMQNAVDALTARHRLEPAVPADTFGVRLYADGAVVRVEDDGIGLTLADVHIFLATIGRSSKRAERIAEQRGDYIGQFGIGLLSCFLVADEIHVLSRSARTPDAPAVEWRARGDGSYTVRTLPASGRPRPGTTVTLTPRADAGEWTRPAQVHDLARHFGSLLRHPVTFDDGEGGPGASVNPEPAPWARIYTTPGARSRALAAYGEEVFGFTPLDTVELDLPAVGLKGIACVLPEAVPAGRRRGHRVHVKGMLLSEQAEEILPEWAFFVRCVVDAESLRPTASRESLYEDDTLAAVRDALAERLRARLAREQEGGLWGDILGALRQEAPRAQLILNQLNPLVRTAVAIDEPELARTSAEALYGQAVLLSRRPLRPAESSLINRSFLDLLAHALRKDS